MPKNIDKPSSPPPPQAEAGLLNLVKDGLNAESLREYLEAHPDSHAQTADYLMATGKQKFLAEHLGSFRVGGRFGRIRKLAEGDLPVFETVIANFGSYLASWKEQGRPYTKEKAQRLGNLIIAIVNERMPELAAADAADFEDSYDVDTGGDELDYSDQPGRFTLLRAQVYGALHRDYPGIVIDPNASLEDFQKPPKK